MMVAIAWTELAWVNATIVFGSFLAMGAGIAYFAFRDRWGQKRVAAELKSILVNQPALDQNEFLERLQPQDSELALKLRDLLAKEFDVEPSRIVPDCPLPARFNQAQMYERLYWNVLPQIYGAHRLQEDGWTVYKNCQATTLGGVLRALEAAGRKLRAASAPK